MAGKIRFDLVSPEKLLYSAEADMVTVPGREGDFAVLAGHEPFISIIRTGLINVKGGEDGDMRIFVRGGFAEVNAEGLIVLAEEAMSADDLDAAALDQRIKNAEEDLADAKDDAARAKAAEALEGLRQMRAHA